MLASSERIVPAISRAEARARPRRDVMRELSSWLSSTSEFSSSDSVPLLPFIVTTLPPGLNSTPLGSSTGALAILDIVVVSVSPRQPGRRANF